MAIKAMAAKLARLVNRMLCYGMQFVDQGAEFYEAQHRKRQVRSLRSKALELGFRIIEVEAGSVEEVSFWKLVSGESLVARSTALRRRFVERRSWDDAAPPLKNPHRVPDPST